MSWYVECVYNRAGHVGRLNKGLAVILRPRMREFESNEPDSNPDSLVSLSASVLGPSEVTPWASMWPLAFPFFALCTWHFAMALGYLSATCPSWERPESL